MNFIAICATLVCAFSTSPLFSAGEVAEQISPRTIQVLIEKEAREALLEVRGPYQILNPHDGSRVTSGLLGKRFLIHELEAGLKWGEEFPGIHQFYIQPRSATTTILVNGTQYSGAIAIYGVNGLIHIVNDVDIEGYVQAVLTEQFSYPLDPEVMSALAILTRTDAYYHVMRHPDSFWHVAASDTHYQGSALVIPGSPLVKAVDSTKHLILVHPQDGANLPFATAWTENSAGKTASYQALFRKENWGPSSTGIETPHAALVRQDVKWTYQIPKQKLATKLDIANVQAIDLFVDRPSNKVYALRVQDGSTSHDFDFFAFQEQLGKQNLQSSDFTVTFQGDSVLFAGYGKGCGVGLCLYSAGALAQNGDNAVRILSKFFPGTFLYNIDALRSLPLQENNATR